MMTSGKIEIRALALEPIHHGAGVSGNVQILRQQEIVDGEGRRVRVPFISGNSIKHRIRWGAVTHALETMGVEPGSLSKPVVDLLYSGGALTKTGGSQKIGQGRELARLFPALGLLGYGAGNALVESRLSVRHLHLVCRENQGRAPEDVHHELLEKRAGFYFSEDFGTRHDQSRSATGALCLSAGEQASRDAELGDRGKALSAREARGGSAQMIYAFQTVRAGSRWWGALHFAHCSAHELMALRAGLTRACEGRHPQGMVYVLGAKGGTGYGRMALEFRGYRLDVGTPTFSDDLGIVPSTSADPGWASYTAHLKTEKEAILAALQEAA